MSEDEDKKKKKKGIFDDIDKEEIEGILGKKKDEKEIFDGIDKDEIDIDEILGKKRKEKYPGTWPDKPEYDPYKIKKEIIVPDYSKDLSNEFRKQRVLKIYGAIPEQTEEAAYEALGVAAAELFYKVHQKEELTKDDYKLAMLLFEDKDYVRDAEAAMRGERNTRSPDLGWTGDSKLFFWDYLSRDGILHKIQPKLKKDLEELANDIYSQKELCAEETKE